MGPKQIVICTGDDQVLFSGASQSVAPSKSGTFVAGTQSESDERVTIPAPAPALVEDDADAAAYCDDPPTIMRPPASRRSA